MLDSPSYYESIPENGLSLAAKHRAIYVFIECTCSIETIRQRIRTRTPLLSQGGRATTRPSVRPSSGLIVVADTDGSIEVALSRVLDAIRRAPTLTMPWRSEDVAR